MVFRLTVTTHDEYTKVWKALETRPFIKDATMMAFQWKTSSLFSRKFRHLSTFALHTLKFQLRLQALQLSDDLVSTWSTSASSMLSVSLTILFRTICYFCFFEPSSKRKVGNQETKMLSFQPQTTTKPTLTYDMCSSL